MKPMRDIFKTAVFRLTAIYVAILAVVCVLFSTIIYQLASNEIDRTSRQQIIGFRNAFGRFVIDEEASEQLRDNEATIARSRLKSNLLLANLVVIGGGAVLCYLFARKTLEPVEENAKRQERFTSDASHELRTPLAVMKSEIEIALRDKKLSVKEARALLQSNLEEVETLNAMTENLLELARSREILSYSKLDLSKVIVAVYKKHAKQADLSGIKLETKVPKVQLTSNSESLQQILSILVDNSIKYAGKGSVLTINYKKHMTSHEIIVADNGVGVAADFAAKIFDRFSRADESRTSQDRSGQGLGLSIAKQLAQAIGGDVGLNKTKSGASFSIVLPISVKS